MTKIFFASDIHGSEVCFRKFVNAASFYGADILILGGDLTAKRVVPVVKYGSRYEASPFGRVETAESDADLAALENRIRANGFYHYRCDEDEFRRIQSSVQEQKNLFQRLILDSLRRWMQFAEERLGGGNVRCYVMLGNDDDPSVAGVLDESNVVVNPERQKVELPGGYEMVSVGYSNLTPFNSPREMSEDELRHLIAEQCETLKTPEKAIFNLHCPPYNSGLDIAPELTSDLSVVMKGGQPSMVPVGSKAIREAIEERQPLLGLHGHVHEARGTAKIGRTVCVNPGSEYAVQVLRGAIVILDKESIKGYQFVSG